MHVVLRPDPPIGRYLPASPVFSCMERKDIDWSRRDQRPYSKAVEEIKEYIGSGLSSFTCLQGAKEPATYPEGGIIHAFLHSTNIR